MHRSRYRLDFTRFAVVVFTLLAAGSACAESLTPDAARRFVADKLFAFNCFDGSRGAGRIYGDGSVVGTIQFRGAGPARTVSLPAGTLRVRGEAVCASLKGMAFEPCFALEKTAERSFRGSWMGFAYCDFTQRTSVAGMSSRRNRQSRYRSRRQRSRPGSTDPSPYRRHRCRREFQLHFPRVRADFEPTVAIDAGEASKRKPPPAPKAAIEYGTTSR